MRWLVFLGLAAAECDPAVRPIGPGTGGTPTTFYDSGLPEELWSCDKRYAEGTCESFIGSWTEEGREQYCYDGTLAQVDCPPSDIGGCRREQFGTIYWYYQSIFWQTIDADFLESLCEEQGNTWLSAY